MSQQPSIIITTINPPTEGVREVARFSDRWKVIVVGDRKTPADWQHPGVEFIGAAEQTTMDSAFARECPFNHYARKNVGYLLAIRQGAPVVAETDDDNIPYPAFLSDINRRIRGRAVTKAGWENVYVHFTELRVWPRGFPLEHVNESLRMASPLANTAEFDCPIQQYLADDNPDVDAVFRLTSDFEIKFRPNTIILQPGTWCPFNSQNTVWWPPAYPLLYLPAYVSFRMTDIWRSFIAQICLHHMGHSLAFRDATMYQIRNEHVLIRDFRDEVPGYLNNVRIMETLAGLTLSAKPAHAGQNLRLCYEALVSANFVPREELHLVDLWLAELD